MRDYLKSFGFLTDQEVDDFASQVSIRKIKKGDFFIKSGRTCQEVGFVQKGVFRSFYYSSSAEETTYCFTFSNSFVTAYSSFLTETPTAENIQALTDCEVLTVSRELVMKLEQTSTNWLRFFKFIAESEYVKMEQRIFQLQNESAEKRYLDLIAKQPEFLQTIPLGHLASYLGITQRHLSRIRKSVSN